jgi:hypothetical protein
VVFAPSPHPPPHLCLPGIFMRNIATDDGLTASDRVVSSRRSL